MSILFALVLSFGMPPEWTAIADVTPEGLAKSIASRCPRTVPDCSAHFGESQRLLAVAWGAEPTTPEDRVLMLKAIEDNTTESGTDWYGARLNYFGRRVGAMIADGRQIKIWAPKLKPQRSSGTAVHTRCYSYWSRSGRSVYSGCSTYIP